MTNAVIIIAPRRFIFLLQFRKGFHPLLCDTVEVDSGIIRPSPRINLEQSKVRQGRHQRQMLLLNPLFKAFDLSFRQINPLKGSIAGRGRILR